MVQVHPRSYIYDVSSLARRNRLQFGHIAAGNDVNTGIEGIFYDHLVDLDRGGNLNLA